MPVRVGPGPVFIFESIAAARRWQFYALRSLFVLGLLAGLALAWYESAARSSLGELTIQQLGWLGESFYAAIATVQLVLVLLVAPAATAGAICADRARGTLTHICVTDLSSSEIVLGKLAARLVPVFGLVAAAVPVLALAGLLGGIVIEGIVTLTAITIVLAVLGCALALAFSVRATKVHEVLMAVYAIEALWVVGPLIWSELTMTGVVPNVPHWYTNINPFVLVWAPYAWPNSLSAEWFFIVPATTLILSCALIAYAVLALRADVFARSGPQAGRLSTALGRVRALLVAWRPSPSLDQDPVLWREWRRGRSTRLARIVWGMYAALALAGTAWGIFLVCRFEDDGEFLTNIGGLEATIGLLLVSLSAPTAMAEERARGGLDVLLTTPLASDRIVLAKWWGAFRHVPALAFLPALGALVTAWAQPGTFFVPGDIGQQPSSFTWVDRTAFACIPVAILLAQAAVVTSVGLAFATWIARVGRAVAMSVASYAFLAVGWLVILELDIVTGALSGFGLLDQNDQNTEQFLGLIAASFCPFGGQISTYLSADMLQPVDRNAFYSGQVIVLLVLLGFAVTVLGITLVTFDRCMGRMPERPRRAPRPPRAVGQGPHARGEGREAPAIAASADFVPRRFTSKPARATGPTHP
jgi:ABC-type transport system involved in multi-copper enzyme maturation permease subunit